MKKIKFLFDAILNVLAKVPITPPFIPRLFDREFELIVQKYSANHRGVDLRCVDDATMNVNLPILSPERMKLIRQGKDQFGNYFIVCKGLDSGYDELKFIHIKRTAFPKDYIFEPGEQISVCILGGNSKELHLHFEVWSEGIPARPEEYFDKIGIKYQYKTKPRRKA